MMSKEREKMKLLALKNISCVMNLQHTLNAYKNSEMKLVDNLNDFLEIVEEVKNKTKGATKVDRLHIDIIENLQNFCIEEKENWTGVWKVLEEEKVKLKDKGVKKMPTKKVKKAAKKVTKKATKKVKKVAKKTKKAVKKVAKKAKK